MSWKLVNPNMTNDPSYLQPQIDDLTSKVADTQKLPISQTFTATGGQTLFALSNSYTVGQKEVFVEVDGVPQLLGEGFTETNSTSITLTEGAQAGSDVVVTIYQTPAGVNTTLTDVQTSLAQKVSYPILTGEVGVTNQLYPYADIRRYGASSGAYYSVNSTAFVNALASFNMAIVPNGTFQVDQIILTGNQKIIGNGSSLSIIQGVNWKALPVLSAKPAIIYINDSTTSIQSDITIQGVMIDGQWQWATSSQIYQVAHGIGTWDSGADDTVTTWRVNIKDVKIHNTAGDGLHVGSHGMEWLIDGLTIDQTYGHGVYMPRLSDSVITNLVSYTNMQSGIYQGVGTDGLAHGGNNKFNNVKIYFAGNGLIRGYYASNYPAMIVTGALTSMNNIDVQQNYGDGLVVGSHMTIGTGLLLDSNGTNSKADSANLRITAGCMYSRLSGTISGNRFSTSSGNNMRTKYGIIIETGKIGYNKYDFTVDEMEYVRSVTTAYTEGYFMVPYSFTINDPTSSLMINGREQFTNPSTIIPSLALGSSSYLTTPTLSGSNGAFNVVIHAGENSSVTRTSNLYFDLLSASGTDNTAYFHNTALASAKYMILWFRCQSDFPIQISATLTNYYSGGNDPTSTDIIVRNINYSSAYRDMMIIVPVNNPSQATTSVHGTIAFTLTAGSTIQNRDYTLYIDNLKYALV